MQEFLDRLRAAVTECKDAHWDKYGDQHEDCNFIDEDFIYPYWSWKESLSDWQITQSSVGPALVQAIAKDLNNFKVRKQEPLRSTSPYPTRALTTYAEKRLERDDRALMLRAEAATLLLIEIPQGKGYRQAFHHG